MKIATPHFDLESKKDYLQPEMHVVEIAVSPLLAGSVTTLFDDTAGGDESLAPGMPSIPGVNFITPESLLGVPELK